MFVCLYFSHLNSCVACIRILYICLMITTSESKKLLLFIRVLFHFKDTPNGVKSAVGDVTIAAGDQRQKQGSQPQIYVHLETENRKQRRTSGGGACRCEPPLEPEGRECRQAQQTCQAYINEVTCTVPIETKQTRKKRRRRNSKKSGGSACQGEPQADRSNTNPVVVAGGQGPSGSAGSCQSSPTEGAWTIRAEGEL